MSSKKNNASMDVARSAHDNSNLLPELLNEFEFPRILPSATREAVSDPFAHSIQRDLVTLSETAEAVLSGSKSAEAQLRNVLAASLDRLKQSGGGTHYNYGLVSAMLQFGDASGLDKLCRDRIRGHLHAVQAAFKLDFASESRGIPLTQAANTTINHGLAFLRGSASNPAERATAETPARDAVGSRGARSPVDRSDLPRRSDGPPTSTDPGFEPGADTVGLPFCDQLQVLIGQAYVDWATGADSDPWTRRIGSVVPRCVVFNEIGATPFQITPPPDDLFPAVQPNDVELMLGDLKINVDPAEWAADRITFHLPAGARSGELRLQGPFAARGGLPPRVLGKILDLAAEMIEQSARVGAGVSIGVIYPPEVKAFRVNAADVTDDLIELEACRDVARITWQVEMQNTPGLAVPECASLVVVLRDEDGNALASSTVAVGYFTLPPGSVGEKSVELVVRITLDGQTIGVAQRLARFRRVSRLRMEMRDPPSPQLIGYQFGKIRISASCSAPQTGTRVNLQSSDPTKLSVPSLVVIPEGVTHCDFLLNSIDGQYGHVTVTARAAGHEHAQLELEILEPHTAVVLSGGGAKGSFEAGAISYLLHHKWETLRVKTVVGTSVGAINALGLAHNQGVSTALRIEHQWLALHKNDDMFRIARWLVRLQMDEDVDVIGLILGSQSGGGGPSIPSIGAWEYLLGVGASTVPLVNTIAVLLGLSTAQDYLDALESIKQYLAGRVRDEAGNVVTASSLFDLDPARRRLADSTDMQQVIDGGLNIRLCMVSLIDGKVYYMDQRGHLLSTVQDANGQHVLIDEAVTAYAYAPHYKPTEGTPKDILVAGAISSSAIPLWLAPVRLVTGIWNEPDQRNIRSMVDGGVREVLPVRAAIDLGARLLVCIAAGHPDVSVKNFGGAENLSLIGLRGLEIQGAEVSREDRLAATLTCRTDLKTILIEPSGGPFAMGPDTFDRKTGRMNPAPIFEVHGTFEIDPSLIRINLAYGYMRAFDEFLRRDSPDDYREAYASTEEIIRERRSIYQWEDVLLVSMWGLGVGSGRPYAAFPPARGPDAQHGGKPLTADELAEGRALKRELFQMVYLRFMRFGPESLPKGFGSAASEGQERIRDWWEFWEHIIARLDPSPTLEASYSPMSLPGRPFDRQSIWNPSTSSVRLEPSQPQAPIVPPNFLNAMT